MTAHRSRFRLIGLRGKLLLATLALFILPVAGLSYLKELEVFLKNNHAAAMLVTARTIASVFQDNASLIALNQLSQSPHQAIYCHSLNTMKQIDGYSDDWFELQNRQQYFYAAHSLDKTTDIEDSLSVLCANDEQYYYFLVTYNQPTGKNKNTFGQVDFSSLQQSNSISFQYLDYGHHIQDYHFKLVTPGWLNGQLNSPLSHGSRKHLPAQWQESTHGQTLEFKIPIGRINRHASFKLQQLSADAEAKLLISTALAIKALKPSGQLNPLILTDPLNAFKLEQLVPENTRLWLLNKQQFINAKTATKTKPIIKTETLEHNGFSILALYRRLYLILMNYPEQPSFYGGNQAKIETPAIQLSLKAQSTTHWLDHPHSDRMVLSVTTPVYDNNAQVIGTLVLEQNNKTLLALQDKTFEGILFLTLFVFFSVLLLLLFLSTRLLKRIINLRNDTLQALSSDGIISNQLYRNDNDEIGDLARSFSTLLTRIEHNNQYLRSLSGKLSHELRTPLTIIKSSLENLATTTLTADHKKYTQRASEGCQRLSDLLNRMSEASRLEQSINNIEQEPIELVSFLSSYIDSLQAANEQLTIIFKTLLVRRQVNMAPELMAQLLDKLLSNAISFHRQNTPIIVTLEHSDKHLLIRVKNYGELIDKNQLSSIFSSLTSYRKRKDAAVHLGLGLYIARLIAQYHNGELSAINDAAEQSVSFILSLPAD